MDMIATFDEEFIMGDLPRRTAYNVFFGRNAGEIAKQEAGVDVALFKKPTNAQKTYGKIATNIAETLEPRKEIKTIDDVKDYVRRVNSHLDAKHKLDADLYSQRIFKKVNKIRDQ